jgi:lipopolysaccharide transport system permease protein
MTADATLERDEGDAAGTRRRGHAPRHVRIRPTRGWVSLRLGDLWDYRELLFFLAWRDVKVRYKQTALGALWAVLQPLALMGVFALFLGHFLKVPSDGVPYPIFAYTALLPWTFFAQSLNASSTSLVVNANLVSKIYFPRLVLPMSATLGFLIDLVIGLALLVGMMVIYSTYPTWGVLLLPVLILLAILTVLAVAVWLSAISARYRDVVYGMPLLVQLWLFASPIAYSSSMIPDQWRWLYALNPMVGVIDGFRWALLGTGSAPGMTMLISLAVTLVALAGGLAYFRRTERTFADTI